MCITVVLYVYKHNVLLLYLRPELTSLYQSSSVIDVQFSKINFAYIQSICIKLMVKNLILNYKSCYFHDRHQFSYKCSHFGLSVR